MSIYKEGDKSKFTIGVVLKLKEKPSINYSEIVKDETVIVSGVTPNSWYKNEDPFFYEFKGKHGFWVYVEKDFKIAN